MDRVVSAEGAKWLAMGESEARANLHLYLTVNLEFRPLRWY